MQIMFHSKIYKFDKICTVENVGSSDGNRTVPSREVPGRSRDRTGQDLEILKVPWSCGPGTKEVQKSRGSPASFP